MLERNRRAKAAEGAHIGQTNATRTAIRYSARIRFYVSEDYRRQHMQWQRALEELRAYSAGVLGPAFGVELAHETRPWSPRCSELADCIDELAALDPGAPDLWVVGVLGDTPRYSHSFELLGMARVVSSHIVLRDVTDLAERKSIDDAFPTLSEEKRTKIYAHRKLHKRLAVFLHEWGHTLGGMHTQEDTDLLNVTYNDREATFSEANTALIATGLKARFSEDEGPLREYVERMDAKPFDPAAYATLVARLARKPQPTVIAPQDPAPRPAPLTDPALAAADQPALRGAQTQADAGDAHGAWTQLSPLVERYPSSHAVQQLACSLGMQLGLMTVAQTACTRLQKLPTD